MERRKKFCRGVYVWLRKSTASRSSVCPRDSFYYFRRRSLSIASQVGWPKSFFSPETESRARPHFSIKLSVTPLTSLSSLAFPPPPSPPMDFSYTFHCAVWQVWKWFHVVFSSQFSLENVLSFRCCFFLSLARPPSRGFGLECLRGLMLIVMQ